MGTDDVDARLLTCSDCGALGLGAGEIACCGSPMEPARASRTAASVPLGTDSGTPEGDAAAGGSTAPDAAGAAGADDGDPYREPALDDLLRAVFGMSPSELDVCLCVMEGGTLTVAELTERVDYDRSVVARHLNHLAALGVVEKRRQLLARGGDVYVYTPEPPEAVRRRFRRTFLRWAADAADRIDELSREKVEGIADEGSATEWTVFREE